MINLSPRSCVGKKKKGKQKQCLLVVFKNKRESRKGNDKWWHSKLAHSYPYPRNVSLDKK